MNHPLVDKLTTDLKSVRFAFSSEADLQEGVGALLSLRDYEYAREVVLGPRDRIDFLVGNVGIEVKVAGSSSVLLRQIDRYLQDDRLSGIVVVTSKASHTEVPVSLHGKPISIVYLIGSVF